MEEGELNKLDLMVAALFCRYRKSEDNWLSGFWARLVIGLTAGLLLLTFLEIILVIFKLDNLKILSAKFYIIVFISAWAISIFCVYKITIPNNLLYKIELAPEDYQRGNILAFLLIFTALFIYGFIILYTKDM